MGNKAGWEGVTWRKSAWKGHVGATVGNLIINVIGGTGEHIWFERLYEGLDRGLNRNEDREQGRGGIKSGLTKAVDYEVLWKHTSEEDNENFKNKE